MVFNLKGTIFNAYALTTLWKQLGFHEPQLNETTIKKIKIKNMILQIIRSKA